MNKKQLGSFYTPQRLANFIVNYCFSRLNRASISVLEPCVGDGAFIEAFNQSHLLKKYNKIELHVVEIINEELNKAIQKNDDSQINLTTYNQDYLSFHYEKKDTYSLVIGNPPYLKDNLLTEEQKDLAIDIHLSQNLSIKRINNIWTAFLVSTISKLEDDGILAFVLPLELLQVKFTIGIRDFLKQSFTRIEIFMFDKLQFQECKGQDTILLIGFKNHKHEGIHYTTIGSIDDLESERFNLKQNLTVSNSNKKWTHHFISSDEYSFLEELRDKLNRINDLVDNKTGIVTAANDFFIVNEGIINQYQLQNYAKPIIRKGHFINGSLTFNKKDFMCLATKHKPVYLLDFNSVNPKRLSNGVKKYLQKGELQELHLRYKCRKRKHWYQIPYKMDFGESLFFKRAHEYPKLLKNETHILVTDNAYVVNTKQGIEIDDFIYSFYNSLTLVFAELEGRYYGGGVLELTPNEFRKLPLPLTKVGDFDSYAESFKNKSSITEVLNRFNPHILNSTLGLTTEEIMKIESIRKKLINKRHRKKTKAQ